MFCKSCGVQNDATSKFCKACGSKLEHRQVDQADPTYDGYPELEEETSKTTLLVATAITTLVFIGGGAYYFKDSIFSRSDHQMMESEFEAPSSKMPLGGGDLQNLPDGPKY